jgi:hypothetical protein
MSVNNAPTNITNTFNNQSFITSELSSQTGITIDEGLDYFLAYPTSQGSETISGNLTVTNTILCDNLDCDNLNGGTTNTMEIGGNTMNYVQIGATVTSSQNIFIGVSEVCNGSISIGCSTQEVNLNGLTNIEANLVSNSQTITPTQLGYVSGATSNIQNQLSNLQSFPEIITNNNWSISSDLTLTNGTTSNVFTGGSLPVGFYNIMLQSNVSINDSTTTLYSVLATIQIGNTLIYSNDIFTPSNSGTLMANGSNVVNITNFMVYNPTLNSVISVNYVSSFSGSTVSPTLKSSSTSKPSVLSVIRLS